MLTNSASLSKGKFLGLMTAGLASATLGLAASPSHAVTLQTGFAGDYAPANWIFNANGGDGSVNTTGVPSSITLTGNDAGGNVNANIFTDYTINATDSGPVKFDWAYSSGDSGAYDSFGYLLNGVYNQLADNGSQGSGTTTFNVAGGDTFGFSVFSLDGQFGAGVATISNFSAPIPSSAPASVPGPLPILGVGAAFAYSRRLRRRINLAKSPVSTDSVVAEQL